MEVEKFCTQILGVYLQVHMQVSPDLVKLKFIVWNIMQVETGFHQGMVRCDRSTASMMRWCLAEHIRVALLVRFLS